MMTMEEQFNRIAGEYDSGRRKFIPCFDDYYDATTAFVAASISKPQRILDLGAGTGLLSMFYLRHFPNAEYLLVDVAGEMLKIAGERFSNLSNINYLVGDYAKSLPDGDFNLIISALSIHHLENEQKQALFRQIYHKLPSGGIFVNYDQFCADTPAMSEWFDIYWITQLLQSGLSESELTSWQERRKLDRECSLNAEIAMLKNSGFHDVNCIYNHRKFAVVIAEK
ncbi:MAG: class I SAM-dependent methyltransferase [Victivallaceae bacterium]